MISGVVVQTMLKAASRIIVSAGSPAFDGSAPCVAGAVGCGGDGELACAGAGIKYVTVAILRLDHIPAVFLASDDTNYVTGTSLVVDGGSEIGSYQTSAAPTLAVFRPELTNSSSRCQTVPDQVSRHRGCDHGTV
ncbi:hypothetical protein [Rhodococcus jostii]|uniref:hypothetical protein n=1 Tax=Rhodococcus jostii TaxID=132919 RepID=UPI001F07ED7C|nr:hypothetical protein [Rhodococcus jostii]